MKELSKPIPLPRWYQDLSIAQMQKLFELGDIMRADYGERITERTQRALGAIGVTSTFVKITSQQIRELRRSAELDPVKFLSEIYRIVTGRYFVDEEYKKFYDCNERIILSAIAFLTLPEIIIELHRRIPMGATRKLPRKPVPQKIPPRKRSTSPYLEPLFSRPDRLAYERELHRWRQQCRAIPKPRAILPPWIKHPTNVELPTIAEHESGDKAGKDRLESYHEEQPDKRRDYDAATTGLEAKSPDLHEDRRIFDQSHGGAATKDRTVSDEHESKTSETVEKGAVNHRLDHAMPQTDKPLALVEKDSHSIAAGLHGNKSPDKRNDYSQRLNIDKFASLSGKQPHTTFGKIPEPSKNTHSRYFSEEIEDRIGDRRLDYSKRPPDKESWLGEKGAQLVVTGITENADHSISYETAGLACVTPDNSDEDFFAALNLTEDRKKRYPRGREYLSRNWQEWLNAADEDFMRVEKEANKIIESIRQTLKLMGPEISCDTCCSCRQTRKANMKYHKTKTPRVVIDSIVVDGKENKHLVGSVSMNSPAPSETESTSDIPEVVASHDEIVKNKIISGVANEMGETKYFVSGLSRETRHVPKRVIGNSTLPKRIKNVPPCGCAIEKMINEGLTEVASDDNISWTKNYDLCIGKKYRPSAIGNCQSHPGDKLCRRNPFKRKVDEKIRGSSRGTDRAEEDDYPGAKKNMYSLAEFRPCGDEDGMAVCGGPWGAVNVPDAEELARREAEAKMILQSPPCGDKPGRAICGEPFGARHPLPKKRRKTDDEDEDEEEEEEELDKEDLKERKKREREERKKRRESKIENPLNRDERCVTVAGKKGDGDKSEKPTLTRAGSKADDYRSKKIARSDKRNKISRGKNEYEGESEAVSRDKRRSSYSNESAMNKSKPKRRSKEEKKQDAIEEEVMLKRAQTKELKNHWNRMKKMANKLIVSPIALPEEPPRMCKREEKEICGSKLEEKAQVLDEESIKQGPFGWRTTSEEALPAEKTLVYLANPEVPVETIPVRAGGKPCKCRENRNKRKTILYNVTAMVPQGKTKRDTHHYPVIDGLIKITPTPSIRISDEYVPEYVLDDSSLGMCTRERKNEDFKYVERFLGPESLMAKPPVSGPCDCSLPKQKILENVPNETLKQNEEALIVKEPIDSPETNWKRAFGDEALINFYSRCRDNVPCWLRCVEFSKTGCCTLPRSLRIKRPVCECRYERKILKREEEKANWLRRNKKLKMAKKEPRSQVAGLYRPMRTETNVIISNVTRTQRKDEDIDDIEYCVSGVTQDRVMGPREFILGGIEMRTPLVTPEMSKVRLPIPKPHRHWSPTNIHREGPTDASVENHHRNVSSMDVQTRDAARVDGRPRELEQTDWKNKLKDSKDKRIDVLFKTRPGNTGDRSEEKRTLYRAETDEERKKYRTKGMASKVERPVLQSVVQEARQGKATGRSMAKSKKKSFTRELAVTDKTNVHTRKSTGSISSPKTREELPNIEKEATGKIDLEKLLQIELEKMAEEGFLFAKLPVCHQMPQLRYWIMYRKGVAFAPEEKKLLMDQSIKIWNAMEKSKVKKIAAPEIEMSKTALENLTFDDAEKIKRDVTSKKAIFYSQLRKSRVLAARTMWNLMEFGKFPGVSFKRAYFTYQPSKESDGFVFKPPGKEATL